MNHSKECFHVASDVRHKGLGPVGPFVRQIPQMNYKAVLKDYFEMCHENTSVPSEASLVLFSFPFR